MVLIVTSGMHQCLYQEAASCNARVDHGKCNDPECSRVMKRMLNNEKAYQCRLAARARQLANEIYEREAREMWLKLTDHRLMTAQDYDMMLIHVLQIPYNPESKKKKKRFYFF